MTPNRDRNLLYPPFAADVMLLEQRIASAGLKFYMFEGLRDMERQQELYDQGRTKPGEIVTNARPGTSWHNFGLAADFVLDGMPDKPGLQWSWDTLADLNKDGHNDWVQFGELVESIPLVWGGKWSWKPDLPHIQYQCGLTINEAYEIFTSEGTLSAVWAKCHLRA